jgi:hypothetical protein
MTSRLTAIILAIGLATGAAHAADKVDVAKLEKKSLPADIYTHLKQGKRASLLWRAAGFLPASPYRVEKVEWLADERNGALLEYTTKQMMSLGQTDGAQYTVQVRVTGYVPGEVKAFNNTPSRLIVEAVVLDKSGTVVAAMVTSEKIGYYGHPARGGGFNEDSMVDKVASALDSEVMKGR